MSRSRRRPRRVTPLSPVEWGEMRALGLAAGLDAVGVTSSRPWTSARRVLEVRRGEGLAGTMAFTYRNPARSTDPGRLLPSGRSLIVAARSYVQAVAEPPAGRAVARVARYASADHYARLRHGLDAIAGELRRLGFRAVVVTDDNALVDREAAWRAGLGWYGHNSLLLRPGEGSWSVLGSVLTDAVISRQMPPVPDGCGTCRRCIPACPTAAIGPGGRVDARRCLAWLLQAPGSFPVEHRAALGDRLYGCDDCQEVCPPNRAAVSRAERSGAVAVESSPGIWLDAVEVLGLDDTALATIVDRWYLPDRDLSVVRRNLLVILGNSGPGVRPGVVDALERYAAGSNPLLAEHAVWAQERLGLVGNNGRP